MIILEAQGYRLELAPERGGAVLRLDWHGEPLMRPACGSTIFDVGSFPLVPFSNRIAKGRFNTGARKGTIAPNFPGSDHPHPLHGFGWLTAWSVIEQDDNHALLEHTYPGGEWPWPYRARQTFELGAQGLTNRLSITNLGDAPMPAGLGFHPYFPRDAETVYRGLHRGEWYNTPDCLPSSLDEHEEAIDWWQGESVDTRAVDTAYTGREGMLEIDWPARGLGLTIAPSEELTTTVVFTPQGQDYFCVEPVSHATDAINRAPETLAWLEPGQTATVSMTLSARTLPPAA
ncbi:aldose 1-epimerase [Novosphingobium sp. PhB57]|uniref:aldose 1-epimerase n=1 Tax=Novosphingobium sp. PhB57 TaxID=2485107 RepID=UPI0010D9791D|nr:aldose 1-epimerase [Novosphingobium sp. PhB57]TCU61006.1 aldose 1-epimerase [Novosphingobium sp. PhB57]